MCVCHSSDWGKNEKNKQILSLRQTTRACVLFGHTETLETRLEPSSLSLCTLWMKGNFWQIWVSVIHQWPSRADRRVYSGPHDFMHSLCSHHLVTLFLLGGSCTPLFSISPSILHSFYSPSLLTPTSPVVTTVANYYKCGKLAIKPDVMIHVCKCHNSLTT